MPKWLKITLLVLAGLAGCFTTLVLVARSWFHRHEQELLDSNKRAVSDARQFGKGADGEGCLREALHRLDANSSFISEVEQRVFLVACLHAARLNSDFCTGVPKLGEILASVNFARQTCQRYDHENDQPCSRLVQGIVEFCQKR